MENAFGRVVSVLVLVVAIFIVPIRINYEKVNYIRTIAITSKTVELVDCVRNKGCLERDMYDRFKETLSKLDMICNVELEHKRCGNFENNDVWLSYSTGDIEEILYTNGSYDFKIGDYFKIIIYVVKSDSREVISYYGGTIRNERT
ncbi:MAG: hypothetical protein ACI4EV_09665 [Lachnospiraceae bacterium]